MSAARFSGADIPAPPILSMHTPDYGNLIELKWQVFVVIT